MQYRQLRVVTAIVMALAFLAWTKAGAAASAPPVFNVRDYGAAGDGNTDDLPAITNAVGALRAAAGGSLYFPQGTYRIGGQIEFANGPGTHGTWVGARIYGDGDTSILKADTTQTHMLYLHDISDVTIDHLRFEGAHVFNKLTNTGAGILMLNAVDSHVNNCTFYGIGTGVLEDPGTSGTIFTNNQILDWGQVGYFVEGHTTITNNQFIQTDPSPMDFANTSSHGMYIHSGAQSVLVQGNRIQGVKKYGIQVYGRQGDTETNGILIKGNTFENNASDIIAYSETNGPVYGNITVSGNSFRGSHGISVYMGKGTNLEVSDNLFVDCGSPDGVTMRMGSWDSGSTVDGGRVLRNTILWTTSSTTSGIDVEANTTQNIQVQDNWITLAGKYGIYVRFATNVTISGNVIWMPPGTGTDFANGVELDEGAYNVQIAGNDVYGTGLTHSMGVMALPNPGISSGTIAGNRFFGAPLTPGPLQVGDNQIAALTGMPVTLFALEDPASANRQTSMAPVVNVVIEGGEDTAAWLLSETDVRMPAVDDPRWQTTKPTTLTLSAGPGVKRVVLWRKLADGTVCNRPEVTTIELVPTP